VTRSKSLDGSIELAFVVGPVVGHDPLDPDSEPGELGGRDLEGSDRAG
jgi:hypothetical protein